MRACVPKGTGQKVPAIVCSHFVSAPTRADSIGFRPMARPLDVADDPLGFCPLKAPLKELRRCRYLLPPSDSSSA